MTPEDVEATPNADLRAENAKLRAHLQEAHALGAEARKGWDDAAAGWRAALLQNQALQKEAEQLRKVTKLMVDEDMNRLISVLRTQLKGAVFFIHLDCHGGATFGECPAPVCSSANEVLGDLAEKRL